MNKKIFAVLGIVALLVALLPTAAFAKKGIDYKPFDGYYVIECNYFCETKERRTFDRVEPDAIITLIEATETLMQRLHTLDWAAMDGGSDAPKCISRSNFKDLLYNFQQPVDEALEALRLSHSAPGE